MTVRRQPRGTCSYCGAEFVKRSMTRHLAACARRRAAIEQAESASGAQEALLELRVQAADLDDFWLDLEVRGTATLKHLDRYLRAIWLECCGHLSQFSLKGWGSPKIGMARKVADVFSPGVALTHIYDFGTESVTLIRFVASRQGQPATAHPIALLARNKSPEMECVECDKPAAWLCMGCVIEEGEWAMLCDRHARKHPHSENYGSIRLVNSPRLGLCGYAGPAEPPY